MAKKTYHYYTVSEANSTKKPRSGLELSRSGHYRTSVRESAYRWWVAPQQSPFPFRLTAKGKKDFDIVRFSINFDQN